MTAAQQIEAAWEAGSLESLRDIIPRFLFRAEAAKVAAGPSGIAYRYRSRRMAQLAAIGRREMAARRGMRCMLAEVT